MQCRYSLGAKSDVGELSFFSGASGNNNRGFTIDSPTDSSWHSMGSSLPPYQLSKPRDSGLMQGGFSYSHFEPSQELGQVTIASLSHSQEQDRRSFGGGGGGGGLMGDVKQENQPLRPFFDEWPGRRDSWSEMDDERSNGTSFSTTQLSISIPMPRCGSSMSLPLPLAAQIFWTCSSPFLFKSFKSLLCCCRWLTGASGRRRACTCAVVSPGSLCHCIRAMNSV